MACSCAAVSSLSSRPVLRHQQTRLPQTRSVRANANEGRSFNEKTGEVIDGAKKEVQKATGKDPMSQDFKRKLREDQISLGGSANKPMGSNNFLIVGLVIGGLALLTKLAGYI